MSTVVVDMSRMRYNYGKMIVPVIGDSGGGGGGDRPTREEVTQEIQQKVTETINDTFGTSAEGVERLLPEIEDNNPNTGILQQIVKSNSSEPSDDTSDYPEVTII